MMEQARKEYFDLERCKTMLQKHVLLPTFSALNVTTRLFGPSIATIKFGAFKKFICNICPVPSTLVICDRSQTDEVLGGSTYSPSSQPNNTF